ncbi:BSD domain-containing protein [Raphanus sativus]|uniref:Uncharacterized protein LOC108813018 n=1 Tax=Raphanus sativus TaxID=3726 RepID=A0A6J0K1R7_RAPSA|nr:uncharacterized protein LOC108813018 [Raphanus sativus]XP_056862691.1 uncharacterized protein LOC130510417 [Raphanus sativus]KAJ4866436.1 BSD domain-containing protein [Raphanus sativus]KAJ4915492.1 BSD domain-containing protein [Raphanus sativus]
MFSNFLESLYDGIRDDEDNTNDLRSPTERHDSERNASTISAEEEEAQARGVKDDLAELSHTLTRKLRGVANFLAPLPERPSSDLRFSQPRSPDPGSNQSCVASDTRETEIRARSWNYSDSVEEEEETDDEEEEEMDAVAVTEEVLAFARNIAMHPETWLDFPLDPEEDLDDLEMSDAQRGHVLAIERLAPRLAALRIELCPCHMTVGYFWKVYFVLLHSRLSKHDAQLLSSPQVMEARALWMKELQSENNSAKTGRGDTLEEEIKPSTTSNYYHHAPPEFLSPRIYAFEPPSIIYPDFQKKTDRWSEDVQFIDKAVIEERPIQKIEKDDDDDDDWPEEEDCGHKWTPMFTVNEDDVSFSDLEGDDDISSLALKCKSTSNGTDQKGT